MTIRIADLPDLGSVTDGTSFVIDNAGTGRMTATALRTYALATTPWVAPDALALPKAGGQISGALGVTGNTTIGSTTDTAAMTALFGNAVTGAAKKNTVAGTQQNCIVGWVDNSLPANTLSFGTGVTGYGVLNAPGSQAFGLFGRADLYTTGVATNEVNSFNFAATPSGTLPPNTSIGTTDHIANALQVVAYGNYPSTLGIYVARGDQPFQNGIYIAPTAYQTSGLWIDSSTIGSAATYGAVVKNYGTGINLALVTSGPYVAANAVITVSDAAAVVHFSVKQSGDVTGNNVTFAAGSFTTLAASGAATLGGTGITGHLTVTGNISNTSGIIQNDGFTLNASGLLTFRVATVTTSASSGSATALPATPQGYVTVQINGSMFKLPYYN